MAPALLASPAAAVAWLRSRGATRLATDSRHVQPGDAFVAWPGYAHDARQYVRDALAAGARAAIVEAQGVDRHGLDRLESVASFQGLKAASGELASLFLGQPSARLEVIAVTGTNGKTSTAWWTAQALRSLGRRCGVIGTLGILEPPGRAGSSEASEVAADTGLTTPDPVALQAAFARFAAQGFAACAIEASSIGIVEHRLAGTRIAVAQFTNFTQDHLDYHGSMEAYWAAKEALFRWPGLRAAVINIDDARGAALAERLKVRGLELWTYSTRQDARLRATGVRHDERGLAFELNEDGTIHPVRTALIGDYNAQNLLAVLGALRALGVPSAQAAAVGELLTPVPGRMQRVDTQGAGPEVIVDYAHTPDALEKALLALQPLASQRGGALWCVFGCGGNRDPGKRPLMGATAASHASHVVVTSDNPRLERPESIVEQILSGMPRGDTVEAIVDRRAAIAHAVQRAAARDVILLAGKGHENYQDMAGQRHTFSDVDEARRALAGREVSA